MPEIITRAEAKARGLPRYFTGTPCKHKHVCERYVGDGNCVECHRLHIQANAIKNRTRVLAWQKAYPDKVSVKGKRSYAARLEKERLRARLKRAANIEALREYARDFMRTQRLTGKFLIEIGELNGLIEKGAHWKKRQTYVKAVRMLKKQTNEEYEKWLILIKAQQAQKDSPGKR